MLEVQKYLRSGKTLVDLESDFGIENTINDYMVSLNYNMITSPMNEEICKECRGLILQKDTWDILAYPFYKFFNYGEGFQAQIDWASVRYMEKLDGSLTILWWDSIGYKWSIATRSMPTANGTINGMSMSFAELAWIGLENVLKESKCSVDKLLNSLNKRYTYAFELTSPYNRIVCEYKDIRMTLIFVRDLDTLQELNPSTVALDLLCNDGVSLPTARTYCFDSLNSMMELINSWNPVEHEGVVVVDKNFNRVKCKNIAYVAIHSAISSVSASDRNLMRLIMLGKEDDLRPIMTDFLREKCDKFKTKYTELALKLNNEYESIKHIDNMKEFALWAQKNSIWPAVLFAVKRKQSPSVYAFLEKCAEKQNGVDHVLSLIKDMSC